MTIDERTLSQESTYPALAVLCSIACPLFLAIIKNLSAFYKPHLSGSRLSWLKQHINQIQLPISNCLAVNIKSKTGINIASLVICNDIRIFFFFFLIFNVHSKQFFPQPDQRYENDSRRKRLSCTVENVW